MRYQRILLKLSGEALMGHGTHGIDPAVIQRLAEEIHTVVARGAQVGIVVLSILACGALHRWAPAASRMPGYLRDYGILLLVVPLLWTAAAGALLRKVEPNTLGHIAVVVVGWAFVFILGMILVIALVQPFVQGEI